MCCGEAVGTLDKFSPTRKDLRGVLLRSVGFTVDLTSASTILGTLIGTFRHILQHFKRDIIP